MGGSHCFLPMMGLCLLGLAITSKAAQSVQAAAACAWMIINNRKTVDDKNELFSLHALIAEGAWQVTELEAIQGNYPVSFFGQVFIDLALSSKNKAPNQVLIILHARTSEGMHGQDRMKPAHDPCT